MYVNPIENKPINLFATEPRSFIKGVRINLKRPKSLIRDELYRAKSVNDLQIKYSGDFPTFLSDKNSNDFYSQFYTPAGELMGGCHNQKELDLKSENCFFKITDDYFLVGSHHVMALRVGGIITSIIIDGKSFPAMLDHLGSVKSLFDINSNKLLFVREFSPFGEKLVNYNPELSEKELAEAIKMEKLVVWSFGHLYENPFLSGRNIYFSKSRTYSAKNGEWLTLDPLVKWSQSFLIDGPENLDGLSYCNGDPVNFVDPSGYYSQELQAFFNESSGRNEPQRAINAIGSMATNVGYVAGAGVAMGTLGIAGPPVLAVVAPKVTGLTLAATIEYNVVMIGVGQYVARNPQKVESFITNSIYFIDNFSGALGGPQTGTPPETWGGAIGYGAGYLLNKGIDSFSSSNSSMDNGFRLYDYSGAPNDSYSFGTWDF